MRRLLVSLFWPVLCGLLIALIVLDRYPAWLSRMGGGNTSSPHAVTLSTDPHSPPVFIASGSHPQGYASAVERAAPAVVSVYSLSSKNDEQSASTDGSVDSHRNTLRNDPLYRRFVDQHDPSVTPASPARTSTDHTTRTEATDSATAEKDAAALHIDNVGSGVILSDKGYILTNQHVIRDADDIRVALRDGREATATVVGVDSDTDLAVLKITLDALPTITVAEANSIHVGDIALAIGNPFNFGQTVTMGIISATGRSQVGVNAYENFIQTDAAINPGNSGGALINTDGELVGINTVIFTRSGGAQGISFAIPSSIAHEVLDDIVTTGYVRRGWIGMDARSVPLQLARSFNLNAPSALVVTNVFPDTPADKAGLKAGDMILSINDTPLIDTQQAIINITQLHPGTPVKLRLFRDGSSRDVVIHVGVRPTNTPLILNRTLNGATQEEASPSASADDATSPSTSHMPSSAATSNVSLH